MRLPAATGHPVRYHEVGEADADAIGPEIGNTWRLLRRTGGWRADVEETREIHPGLRTFDTWLAETGAARIKALLDNEKATATR